MQTRFKTFREFKKGILVAYTEGGGISVICRLRPMVILKLGYKPWGDEGQRKAFLKHLYFQQVLAKSPLSLKISRPEGFYYLGLRVHLDGLPYTVVDAWQATHRETGEAATCMQLYSTLDTGPFPSAARTVINTQVSITNP